MKKKICIMLVVGILAVITLLTGNTYADTIDTIQIDTNKTIVRPGEQVTVTVSFGQELGTYTMDIAYDNALFEYVSAEGGTPNDLSDKVRVVFHDSSGGSNPRTDMSVTFKAKEGITTSNPTEFMVTAEGMANADASVTYDDILVPIVKNVTVEPEYVDYTFDLQYTNPVMKEKETEIVLSYSSPMGRYYEHARLIAEAATPSGASVTLVGTDEAQLKHDLIQSGWEIRRGDEYSHRRPVHLHQCSKSGAGKLLRGGNGTAVRIYLSVCRICEASEAESHSLRLVFDLCGGQCSGVRNR